MKIILVTEFFYCGQKIMYNGLQFLALQSLKRGKTIPERVPPCQKVLILNTENHSSENWAKPFSISPQRTNRTICKTIYGKAFGLKTHPGRLNTHLQLLQQSLHDVQKDIPRSQPAAPSRISWSGVLWTERSRRTRLRWDRSWPGTQSTSVSEQLGSSAQKPCAFKGSMPF